MRTIKTLLQCCIILFLNINYLYAQDLLDDVSSNITKGDSATGELFTENINIISRSGKIFILSNSNQLLNKGDFITMSIKGNGPVARAVVAKIHEGQAGIKILKVYSLTRWNGLYKGSPVDILKGDDSGLFNTSKKTAEKKEDNSKIESEEDLFNEKSLVNEDISDFYTDNRIIKPDNIVTIAYNQFRFIEKNENETIAANQFNIAWAYQFSDNYWAEGLFGIANASGYPVSGTQTLINNFTARLKYSIKAPLYSYVFPYIGFQTIKVNSPDAGQTDNNTTQTQADNELKTIADIEKTHIILGVTVLRRLVPGWFVKADIGSDFGTTILNIGFGIEF